MLQDHWSLGRSYEIIDRWGDAMGPLVDEEMLWDHWPMGRCYKREHWSMGRCTKAMVNEEMLRDHWSMGRCMEALGSGQEFPAYCHGEHLQHVPLTLLPFPLQLPLKLPRKRKLILYNSLFLRNEDKLRENGNPLLKASSKALLSQSSDKTNSLGTGNPKEGSWRFNEHFHNLCRTDNSNTLSKHPGGNHHHEGLCGEVDSTRWIESQKPVFLSWIFCLLSNFSKVTLGVRKVPPCIRVPADKPNDLLNPWSPQDCKEEPVYKLSADLHMHAIVLV